jgi:hypothetical protein
LENFFWPGRLCFYALRSAFPDSKKTALEKYIYLEQLYAAQGLATILPCR